MEILNIRVMRGPNYWSNYRKNLIVMKLDLGGKENLPTNKIDGFSEALERLIPSLRTHRCSVGEEGGFLKRVQAGTWMGHVVEHIALELQSLAGMECGYGRTRSTIDKGVYHVVFSYVFEKAGVYAAKAAVRIVETLSSDMAYNLEEDIKVLQKICRREQLGPSTLSLIKEAQKRNIPYTRLNNRSMLMLGQGVNQKIICASMASTTSSIAVDLASDKESTRQLLAKAFIPVPEGTSVYDEEELNEAITKIGFPLAIKPLDGNHGRGVTTNIINYEQALKAFYLAKGIAEDVIVEKFIQGTDYRFLLVNHKLVAVAKRVPAMVIGDSKSTIEKLIEEVNSDPRRGDGHEKVLTSIKVDQKTNEILIEKNMTLNTVLPVGEILYLKDTANLSTGGTANDVTEVVHPDTIFLAERIARLMNLDICGIDIISRDITQPLKKNGGAVLEVNAGPGFRMHLSPSKGLARNVAEPVLDMLYPNNAPSRIPLVAVTGTNGKTTVTRLIAHLAKTVGKNVGFTTTDGIYINDNTVCHGDCSGPMSVGVILRDPLVDFAVFECARGGILRAGLGFDKCNISIVTNITGDHLGLNDIHTNEDLFKVKSVVPQSTFDDGYAILNADDELVYKMKRKLDCNTALFSMTNDNEYVKTHCENGGLAAFIEDNYFIVAKGEWKTRIAKVNEVPLTFNGTASCMIQNILPALLAATISNFSVEHIKEGLNTFIPSAEQTPGRMNLFRFANFRMMVDYAHNEAGFIELKKYMSNVNATKKTGIITATGDRRPQDIRSIGIHAAEIFDEIIIRHDKDTRGRTCDELTDLITEGIREINKEIPVKVISDEQLAIQYAIVNAERGAFIFACADNVYKTIEMVNDALELQKFPDMLITQDNRNVS